MTAPALIKQKLVFIIDFNWRIFLNNGSGSGLRKNAGSGFNLSGSATLALRSCFDLNFQRIIFLCFDICTLCLFFL